MPEAITSETIQAKLCAEIEMLLSLNAGAVNADTYLPPLGIDSLRFVSLMLMIEQEFSVNLMKGGIKPENTKTVRTLTELVIARRNG